MERNGVYKHTLQFKSMGSVRFFNFLERNHQGCDYLIKNRVKTVILSNVISKQRFVFYFCDYF